MQTPRILILLVFLLTAGCLSAQVSVNGKVTDSLGKPVQSVSITLKKTNGIVLAFAITNNSGAYKIQFANASVKDSLFIEANAIAYKNCQM
jgi:uncharacterized membrane protein YdcZ (DUF606 family)